MRLEELLGTLDRMAESAGLSKPFIVGGFPSDRLLGLEPSQIMDIDVTTGNHDCLSLALLASRHWPDAHYR